MFFKVVYLLVINHHLIQRLIKHHLTKFKQLVLNLQEWQKYPRMVCSYIYWFLMPLFFRAFMLIEVHLDHHRCLTLRLLLYFCHRSFIFYCPIVVTNLMLIVVVVVRFLTFFAILISCLNVRMNYLSLGILRWNLNCRTRSYLS